MIKPQLVWLCNLCSSSLWESEVSESQIKTNELAVRHVINLLIGAIGKYLCNCCRRRKYHVLGPTAILRMDCQVMVLGFMQERIQEQAKEK